MSELVTNMYVLGMLDTRLLFDSDLGTPLGNVRLVGTAAGAVRNQGRVMHEYALVYSVAGTADYRDELGTARELQPGTAAFVFPGLRHWYGATVGGTWEQVYVVFGGPVFQLMETQGLLQRAAPITQLHPVDEWLSRFLTLADRPRPVTQADAMIMVGDFLRILLLTLASSPQQASWLTQARNLIDTTVAGTADFEQIAAELGSSHETFRKRFRKESGEPPVRYRNRRRIEIAQDLLTSTGLSLRQIAATLGYTDEFHLSKRFKSMTGVSPRTFRSERDRSRVHE